MAAGSSWIRTAYFWEPRSCTSATPLTMEMRWLMVWPYWSSWASGMVGLYRAMFSTGWSAGLERR